MPAGDREGGSSTSGRVHLEWRVRLFLAAAVLAMVGMALDVDWLVWVALGLLLSGFVLRFLPGFDADEPEEAMHDGGERASERASHTAFGITPEDAPGAADEVDVDP